MDLLKDLGRKGLARNYEGNSISIPKRHYGKNSSALYCNPFSLPIDYPILFLITMSKPLLRL